MKIINNIAFNCPICNELLRVPDELLGKAVECPKCQTEITLPEPAPLESGSPEGKLSHTISEKPFYCICPVCGKTKNMRNHRILYNYIVCKKCYSGFGRRRRLAFLLDLFLLYFVEILAVILLTIALLAWGYKQTNVESYSMIIIWIVAPLFTFKDSIAGYSPGKMIFGLRVIDEKNGKPTGIVGSLLRTLPLYIPFMPFIVAFQLGKGHRRRWMVKYKGYLEEIREKCNFRYISIEQLNFNNPCLTFTAPIAMR